MQAIIFDFDGVIVDSEPQHHAAFAQIADRFGVTLDHETYLRDYIGFDDRDAIDEILKTGNVTLSADERAALLLEKADIFEDMVAHEMTPLPGVVELIDAAAAVMPIAIATGAIRRDIDAILANLVGGRLPQLFSAIVTADDVTRSKPDPATYALAAQKLGINATNCLAIEDTITGLASARGAGMATLAVTTSYPAEALAPHADHVIPRLSDITLESLIAHFPDQV